MERQNLKTSLKKQTNEEIRKYILANPGSTYEQVVKDLGLTNFSKPHFFTMRTRLKKAGLIPGGTKAPGPVEGKKKVRANRVESEMEIPRSMMTLEIIESLDITGFSEELKRHYKSHILPLLQKHLPDGPKLHLAFLSDPPVLEIRRFIS